MEFRQSTFGHLSIALLAAAVSVPLSTAQIRGGFGRGPAHGFGFQRGARSLNRGAFWGAPFFYSDYDVPEPYVEGNAEENAPQVVVVQSARGESQQKPKPGPLLIEWRGDRYVRLGDVADSQGRATSSRDYVQSSIAEPTTPSAGLKRKQFTESQSGGAPTILVYRDGHREEIADYTIAGGAIYIHDNYWQSGYWTKDVPLSALDASATVEANQQRGIKFLLPSAANVVIASF